MSLFASDAIVARQRAMILTIILHINMVFSKS